MQYRTKKEVALYIKAATSFIHKWHKASNTRLDDCRLPQTMQVAVLIDGNYLLTTSANHRLWFILQIDSNTTALGLNVDKYDVMLLGHGMQHATHLDLDFPITHVRHHRHMFLATGLHRIGNQLLHLLATADHINARIYNLLYHIATMAALEKFCCHKYRFSLNVTY